MPVIESIKEGYIIRENIKSANFSLMLLLILSIVLMNTPDSLMARQENAPNGSGPDIRLKPTVDIFPNTQRRLHDIGNMFLVISNNGRIGHHNEGYIDPETGREFHSLEYPAFSDIEHLYVTALWVGGRVNDDTLVSVGYDGWRWVWEMHPDTFPDGEIIGRSSLIRDPNYHPEAISEQDYIAEYTDTVTNPAYVPEDTDDDRPHIPLNLKIQQRSYAWSGKHAEDFILCNFTLTNIGTELIQQGYIGLYVDADIYDKDVNPNGYDDDICGFKKTVLCPYGGYEDTLNLAWVADADGDPVGNYFGHFSPLAATGIRLLSSSNPEAIISFNWWVSAIDWGPVQEEWPIGEPIDPCLRGIPAGDACKYSRMSNGEIDYDQLYTAIDYSDQGWFPPPDPNNAIDVANGYDIRYLYSFGPFDIDAGDSATFTLAYIGGDNFHDRPDDFQNYFDSEYPDHFKSTLNFADLVANAIWAGWVYDNPGIDTDGDGKHGRYQIVPNAETGLLDTFYYAGDGIPDFNGPPPPPSPTLRFKTEHGRVTIKWNGQQIEAYRDPFSHEHDFEGYRAYMTDDPASDDFTFLASYDLIDFYRYIWDDGKSRWLLNNPPFTLDSLRAIYNDDELQPLDYTSDNPYIDRAGNRVMFIKID